MAYSYNVYYGTNPSGPWTFFNNVSINTDTISGLVPGTTYYIKINTLEPATGLQSVPAIIGPFTTTTAPAAPVTPAQASAAGFNNLVFNDDFTTANTITATSATTGFNWYALEQNPSYYTVSTTQTAAQLSNGNTSGGSNASPNGGILNIINGRTNNDVLQSCAQAITGTAGQQGNSWLHGYIEAYIQYKSTDSSPGWPAFWSFQTGPTANAHNTELDFFEINANANSYGLVFHTWFNNFASQVGTGAGWTMPLTSEWHTYGCLWVSTGAGTGKVTGYVDNVQVGSSILTGTGTNVPYFENGYQYLILGTDLGWPMHIDWVRVWQ